MGTHSAQNQPRPDDGGGGERNRPARAQTAPPIRICGFSLALSIGLLIQAELAFGQILIPLVVAQTADSGRPSGVLTAPPPAPVAVPSSGVLPTAQRRGVVALPFKWSQKIQTAENAEPVGRRHVPHPRPVARHQRITRMTTIHHSVAPASPIVSTSAEPPSGEETGSDLLLAQLGKGKVSK
jgi:hypothetical protein